jgi:hypothetical protein
MWFSQAMVARAFLAVDVAFISALNVYSSGSILIRRISCA